MHESSGILRRVNGGHAHWCPGCGEMHRIPDNRWTFNGSAEAPTFSPSVKHEGKQTVIVDGKWTGDWVRGADGKALDLCCHYFIKDGQIEYCGDCTHSLAGQTLPLPEIPPHLSDEDF